MIKEPIVNGIITASYKAPKDSEQFGLSRKQGLGATDAASIVTLNKYQSRNKLVQGKCRPELTTDEKQIGKIPAVKEGVRREPELIMQAALILGCPVLKPEWTYRFIEYPMQYVNFDGVMDAGMGVQVPIECKYVTEAGEKNYDMSRAFFDGTKFDTHADNPYIDNPRVKSVWKNRAASVGIPVQYWVQLQIQMAALAAPEGYLIRYSEAHNVYMIHRDIPAPEFMQGYWPEAVKVWEEIEIERQANGFYQEYKCVTEM